MKSRVLLALLLNGFGMWLFTSPARAQTLSGAALVNALRKGGYVIVMRHASSPRETPNPNADNVNKERQLDAAGRASATGMGKALRDLKIPVGEVLTSPTYRALETTRFAQWTSAKSAAELGDNGQGMQQVVPETQAAWLQMRVTQAPKGTNTSLVTHLPNINRAFPQSSANLEDGEALIFAPDGKGGATVVARIKIEEWSHQGA